jgi:L-lysine 6-transaminase
MCAFDLPDAVTRDRFKKLAFENGMLILGSGPKSIRFRPTLSVGKEEVEQGILILRRVLSSL